MGRGGMGRGGSTYEWTGGCLCGGFFLVAGGDEEGGAFWVWGMGES